MKRVAIKVTLEREIWISKEVWEESFGEQLPCDIEDLEMLEDESLRSNTELKDVKVVGEFELTD
ncbi:hypothetical protein [Paenibacillus donghaensis]|uniref:Uncharacterized protein n=1 Tax=Paenibacillus donghaensis TaxID=414771 RepID=A0A2Z2KAJ5_9BACL|nr:hypothetical protein [Paenibacillus donghaensis]ASA22624.1 hypothetical protein B9T62_18630 [Paenibacillus donghaensis]